MRHADSRAALDHYDFRPEPDERGEICALPEQAAPVHALIKPQPSTFGHNERRWEARLSNAPVFLERHSYQRVACGKLVKVVLSFAFHDADPDACQPCAHEIAKLGRRPCCLVGRAEPAPAHPLVREDEEDDIALWRAGEDQRRAAGERRETSEL